MFPYRAITYLELYDQLGFFAGSCSGTLVGPDAILTAAHCLYNPAFGGWIGSIAVVPGKDGALEPFGFQFAQDWWVPDAWIPNGGNSSFDWGIIELPDSTFGDSLGWLPMVAATTQTLERSDFTPAIVGYPGDQPAGTMWGGVQNAFLSVQQFLLTYVIDTASGQSGSAIFSLNTQQPFLGWIIGIHTTGSSLFNSGTRIDETLLLDILTGCAVMGCSVSAFIEGGPTVTPAPTAVHTPFPSQTATATPIRPTPTGTAGSSQELWGDADCDGEVTTRDNQALLRFVLEQNPLSQTPPCPLIGQEVSISGVAAAVPAGFGPLIWGNLDCSLDGVTTRDNQALLREVLDQDPLSQTQPCPPVDSLVNIGGGSGTPTSTPEQTATPTPTPTDTESPTPTDGASETPTPTATPTQSPTPTATATQTQTATPTPGNLTINSVAVDTNTSGNSANTVGTINECLEVSPGVPTMIDVVVQGVPPEVPGVSGGLAGFQFILAYNPQLILVDAVTVNWFLGASAIDFSVFDSEVGNPPPAPGTFDDYDGEFTAAAADFGPAEGGNGVLARITLVGSGNGVSDLDLIVTGNNSFNDTINNTYTVQNVVNGRIAVGTANC